MTTAETTTKLPADLGDVRRKLEQLAAEGRVSDLIDLVLELLVRMRDSNNALATRLRNALRELYGRKSQKVSSEQLAQMLAGLAGDGRQVRTGQGEDLRSTVAATRRERPTSNSVGRSASAPRASSV